MVTDHVTIDGPYSDSRTHKSALLTTFYLDCSPNLSISFLKHLFHHSPMCHRTSTSANQAARRSLGLSSTPSDFYKSL
ncbi:hypothetical protein CROQUDRAFT_98282 [Cronartium quercuum f. sp. fusiforme G11]|uniref:Uncharacterized protein n=1 Tax=Cronartium quercuum f. sp. fusiforme G11 TaxID=708437 RepID=A0A9P6N8H6_9BASI|nr:hypothetical protein CROQUDRAFT_98282 [Cronartium quercuum f. sp. fusiforme G11]